MQLLKQYSLLGAGSLLFLSLACLRMDLLRELDLSVASALPMGLFLGWWYDTLFIVFFGIAGICLKSWGLPLRPTLAFFALLLWASALANTLYFSFFGVAMEWWVIQYYWSNALRVTDSAGNMGSSGFILVSALFFGLSLWAIRSVKTKFTRRRSAVILTVLLPLFLLARQSPVWFGLVPFRPLDAGPLFTSQVLRTWFDQASSKQRSRLRPDEKSAQVLAQFRDQSSKSLFRDFIPTRRRYWLRRLNLNPKKPINLVLLFMESARAYEFQHPTMGPTLFPRLRKIFRQHGVSFTNAYTSALNAGQTVRGRFATLCSQLSNIGGPAVTIAHPTIQVICLTDLLAKQNYDMFTMLGYDLDFHNKKIFERFHGADQFIEEDQYVARGITKKVGTWGLADREVLQENIRILEERTHSERPYFADITTVSTHHPFTIVPEGPVPAVLLKKNEKNRGYQGYLSRMAYTDRAVGSFLRRFFERSISDNTLVVVLADHSVPLTPPGLEQDNRRKTEIYFRIPLALLSKNPRQPGALHHPVHQADIAPTIASILGLSGKVTFLGKNLATKPATPFLFQYPNSEVIHYRNQNRACYTNPTTKITDCYRLESRDDPMFASVLQKTVENRSLTNFYKRVIKSNRIAIRYNLFIPRETLDN